MARRKKADELRERLSSPITSDAEALRLHKHEESLRRQAREAKKVARALQSQVDELEERQSYLDLLLEAQAPKPFVLRKHRGQGKRLPAAAYFMAASDWHVGERVRPETVGWKNEYNPEIAQERAEQFFRSQLTMLNAARSAWDVRDGVLWLGGDLMNGYIHEEYLEENFLAPNEEALLIHDVFVRGIDFLLANSDLERIVVPTSNGNHGRTGERMKSSTSYKNSYEWLAYQHLARWYANEPRLKFQVGVGYHNVVDVYGFRVNFHHGDEIKYAGGVGGTAVPANRRLGRKAQGTPIRWEGTPMGNTHLDVFGHFHHLMFPKWFVQNGSLIGWNAYAESKGLPFEDPKQCSFVVDEKHLEVSNFNPIFVTGPST